jgi:ATP-binding cassette, subfamily B (MDR/TAP), member 1
MPVYWFDFPKNNAGSLNARLSNGCHLVNGLTTTFVTVIFQNISSLISGMIIAFIFEWKIALIATGMIPFIIIAGII